MNSNGRWNNFKVGGIASLGVEALSEVCQCWLHEIDIVEDIRVSKDIIEVGSIMKVGWIESLEMKLKLITKKKFD